MGRVHRLPPHELLSATEVMLTCANSDDVITTKAILYSVPIDLVVVVPVRTASTRRDYEQRASKRLTLQLWLYRNLL